MPAVVPQVVAAQLPLDRFVNRIEEVETKNYKEFTEAVVLATNTRFKESAFLEVKYGVLNKLINAPRELERIAGLTQDWDSYGAEPPNADAIRKSKEILNLLAGGQILPSSLVPSATGGVSIYFIKGDRTAYIENYNSGEQALVMYDRQGHTDVLEIGTDIQAVEVTGRISAYLG